MKLLARYSRIYAMLIVLAFLLSSTALYFFINRSLVVELDEVLMEIKERAQNYTSHYNKIPVNSALDDYSIQYTPVNSPAIEEKFETISKYSPDKKRVKKFRQLGFFSSIGGLHYRVTIYKPIEGVKDMTKDIVAISISTILLVMVLLAFINRVVLQRLWKPFYKSLDVIHEFEINKGIKTDFPETGIEEFNYMNQSLRRMTQKAGEDYLALKEFTENASHELQTPLAVITAKLDLLIQDEMLSERQEKKIMSAYAAVKKMTQLNQSLLLSAKIGNRQFPVTRSIPLKPILEEKLAQFKELWEDYLVVEAILEESTITMNPELNDTLINNLLSNATRHNILNGFINIYLEQGKLSISNSGSKEPLDKTRLFKRFYKPANNSAGNGLGLSIVKQICDSSGIFVTYEFKDNSHHFNLFW